MKNKHTPGPWKINSFNDRTGGYVIADKIEPNICEMNSSRSIEETKFNAHLIAAAPELLEALEALTKAGERGLWGAWADNTPNGAILKKARDAIEKATGQGKE